MRCASVRKKGSTEQCSAKPVLGHTLCGRHAKSKCPTLWADVHSNRIRNIPKVQALVRGWLVRIRLKAAGPGVLSRKKCSNDEDLNTYTEKEKVHPFEYFGLEENGKTWWFEFNTIWKWSIRSVNPTNPYTKVPLSVETRKRLRDMWNYGQRTKFPSYEESSNYNERTLQRWMVLCQAFQDNGFGEFNPHMFMRLTKPELYVMFSMIHDDVRTILNDKDLNKQQLLQFCARCKIGGPNTNLYLLQAPYYLLLMMSFLKNPYPLVFTILSALYRI